MDTTTRGRARAVPAVAGAALVLVLLALSVVAAVFHARGGRWFDVISPSMGTQAPVGTLVLTEPAGTYSIGDVVTFTAPGSGKTYTHRIVDVSGSTFATQGDVNGSRDPWLLTEDRIVGKATHYLYGMGWVARSALWLAIGWLFVWLMSLRSVPKDWQWPLRIMGGSFVVTAVSWLVRPWLGAEMTGFRPEGSGVTASIVSTGVLPIRAVAQGGTFVDLNAGQVGMVHTDQLDQFGFFRVVPEMNLTLWWWVAVILFCAAPLLYCLIVGLPATVENTSEETNGTSRSGVTVVALVAALTLAPAVSEPVAQQTSAGFTASVRNTNDTTGARTFFTCRAAETSIPASTWVAYPMSEPAMSGSATDISGRGFTGTYTGTVGMSNTSGCVRDSPVRSASFTNGCLVTPAAATQTNPLTYSIEVWFASTDIDAKLAGFGTPRTGTETSFDRILYIGNDGRLVFGVRTPTIRTISSPAPVNTGAWQHAVATMSATGSNLYLNGVLIASDPAMNTASNFTGFWRFGCGNLTGWPNATGNTILIGRMNFSAIYTVALTPTQVMEHYLAGSP